MNLQDNMFSLSGDILFYKLLPCPNCKGNVWEHDWVFFQQSKKRRKRFECFFCGADYYPGGPVNYRVLYPEEEDITYA